MAAKAAAMMIGLPFQLRRHSIPGLLGRLERAGRCSALEPETIAGIVRRVARLRVFRIKWYPRICLRRALVLFGVLRRDGHPAVFTIGVRETPAGLRAHSWVALGGHPVAERALPNQFRVVYTYPNRASSEGGNIQGQELPGDSAFPDLLARELSR